MKLMMMLMPFMLIGCQPTIAGTTGNAGVIDCKAECRRKQMEVECYQACGATNAIRMLGNKEDAINREVANG